ncbi:MAG TPA: HAD family hydrolase [Phycisphaerales bacterium]|nr:HAD family hydrolase [Phycisphaerales bacterium]
MLTSQPPLAIIFDCDGVLVDSELLGNQVLAEVLTEHGVPFTAEQSIATFMGSSLPGIVQKATALAGRDMRHACEQVFMQRLTDAFNERLSPIAGIPDLVASITLPKAVASSSPVPRIELSLRRAGIHHHFAPHIYSADHVKHPKPAPDIFLLAAGKLGVPPARCLVIEDSATGVAAAHAAGMPCIAFTAGGHCTPAHTDGLRATTAEHHACSTTELAALLRRLTAECRG